MKGFSIWLSTIDYWSLLPLKTRSWSAKVQVIPSEEYWTLYYVTHCSLSVLPYVAILTTFFIPRKHTPIHWLESLMLAHQDPAFTLDFYELMRQFPMPWPESHSEDALTGYNEATAATSKGSLLLVGPQFWQYGVSFGSSSIINK